MKVRRAISGLFVGVLLLLAALAAPTHAGGWAIATLDALPARVVAGEPLEVGFVVRRHGQQPQRGLAPKIVAIHETTGETVTALGADQGAEGHYQATITLPAAGIWAWQIHALGWENQAQALPPLTVVDAVPAVADRAPVLLALVGLAGLTGAAGTVRRARRVGLLLGAAALLAIGGALGAVALRPATPPAASAATIATTLEPGAALFLAKGCGGCHRHDTLGIAQGFSTEMGPALTIYRGDPSFLRDWLREPAARRPTTQMPTLGLSDAEIEGLVAYLSQRGRAR